MRNKTASSPAVVWLAVITALLPQAALAVNDDADAEFDQSLWDGVVSSHVTSDGFVNYEALARDTRALDTYLTQLAAADLDDLDKDERLATLINAYNAFTVRLIIDYLDQGNDQKLQSITDIPEAKRWKHQRWNLGGSTVSLDQIEHEIIRKQFDEPRIHWALVCAAYSCPPLRSEAYEGDTLDAQLAGQERVVLDPNGRFTRADKASQTIYVSRLFEWYGGDFGDWKQYLNEYYSNRPGSVSYAFRGYDWKLNSIDNQPRRR